MFWYFHTKDDGTAVGQSVFCQPTIEAFNVVATASINNGSLTNVTIVDKYQPANDVTGLSGQAYNASVDLYLDSLNGWD